MSDRTFTILSKKAFRFKNPDPNTDVLKSSEGGSTDVRQVAFKRAYFETTPGVIQTAPIWIKDDNMYKWATSDGDIVEVIVPAPGLSDTDKAIRAAVAQQGATVAESEKELDEEEDKTDSTPSANSKMSKAELLEHAAKYHKLELDPAMTKGEILNAIEDAKV